jgi:hypothetical protein
MYDANVVQLVAKGLLVGFVPQSVLGNFGAAPATDPRPPEQRRFGDPLVLCDRAQFVIGIDAVGFQIYRCKVGQYQREKYHMRWFAKLGSCPTLLLKCFCICDHRWIFSGQIRFFAVAFTGRGAVFDTAGATLRRNVHRDRPNI